MPTIHQTMRHFHSADLLAFFTPENRISRRFGHTMGRDHGVSLQLGSVPCSGAPTSVGPAGGTFSGCGTSPQPSLLPSDTTHSCSVDPTAVCWAGSQNWRAPERRALKLWTLSPSIQPQFISSFSGRALPLNSWTLSISGMRCPGLCSATGRKHSGSLANVV